MSQDLVELLKEQGIDLLKTNVHLMRHADKNYPDLFRYVGTRALALYQSVQNREYSIGDLIIGFFGHKPKYALLLGVWTVMDRMDTKLAFSKGLLEGGFEHAEGLGKFYHELKEQDLLANLRLSLEINWGKELAWHRVLKPNDRYECSVIKGCPVPFKKGENISLVYSELRMVLTDIDWKKELGGYCGIYLITDERNGKHYVGSASGSIGILSRWTEYATTGHGGNKELVELLNNDPSIINNFRFTLLEKLPLGISQREAVEKENFWKIAVSSRRHGYNCN